MEICMQMGGLLERYGIEKTCQMISNAGFTAVEMQFDHAWFSGNVYKGILPTQNVFDRPIEEVVEYYKNDLEIIKKYNLKPLQAHAPFPAYVSEHPQILDYAIETYKKCIKYCDIIGIKNLVIHGISRSRGDSFSYEQIHDLNIKLYSSLIDELKGTSVTVCLENLFEHCGGNDYIEGICADPYEAVDYIDTLNKMCGEDHFGLCLDTGHLNIIRGEVRQYVSILGNRIKCTHIHDNDGHSDEHLTPYAGTFSWEHFLVAFKAIKYEGYFSFETYRQYCTWVNLLPEELVEPMFKTIGKIGQYFVKTVSEV